MLPSAPLEPSVTTSLRELQRLEAERVHADRQDRLREQLATEAAQRDAERERIARARREEDAWVARAQLDRAEAARTAAMARAIVERAKIDATAKALAEEKERDHRRQLELAATAAARPDARARRFGPLLALLLAATLFLGAILYSVIVVPQWQRRVVAANADTLARDATIADLRAKLAANELDLANAQRDLAASSRLLASAVAAVTALPHARALEGPGQRIRARASSATPSPDMGLDTHCDPASRDPLCASIGP